MKKEKANKADIVKPIIRNNGEKHLLETMFEGDHNDLPVITSVGYMPLKEGHTSWVSYLIKTKGKEVISIEVDEPNLRELAEESAKVLFVTKFMDQGI